MLDRYLLNDKSYKKIYPWVIGTIGVIAFMIFIVALQPTAAILQKYFQAEKALASAQRSYQSSQSFKKGIAAWQQQVKKRDPLEQGMLETIASFCVDNHLELSYSAPVMVQYGKISVEKQPIQVTGSFQDILQLAYLIEQKKYLGSIGSLQYALKQEPSSKENYLETYLCVQNIQPWTERK